MSSSRKFVVYIFLVLTFASCSQFFVKQENISTPKKTFEYKSFDHEDKYIMFALEFDRQGQKEESRELYKRLYTETKKEEYLFEYLKNSFSLKKYKDVINIVESNKNTIAQEQNNILKIYILSLMQENDYEKAQKEIIKLLENEKDDRNYELLGNIYIQKEEYKKAKNLYFDIYKRSVSESSLINLSNIMYVYLNEKKEAVNILESYIKINGCGKYICSKLLGLYQEEKNIDGIISILKKSYYESLMNNDKFNSEKVYKLLMYYLQNKDVNDAIAFLEESKADDEKLLTLYRNTQIYDKAFNLAKDLYKKTLNIDYLAQIAMIEFEMAKDKKIILDDVIKKFEDVLIVLDNHVYQNYLGYILIDFDIDIKKGISYVKKALEKAPNNLAYIDSLAWGQYKLDDCENAYKNMKKVVDNTGLDDDEIKTHWEKIKECRK